MNRKKQRAADKDRMQRIGRSIITLAGGAEKIALKQRSPHRELLRGYVNVLRAIGGELAEWGQ